MDKREKGNRFSTWQIITAVVVPVLVVLLPLVFGDTPFSRALWGRVLAPPPTQAASISAVLAAPIEPTNTDLPIPTLAPTAENTAASIPSATPTEAPAPIATQVAAVCPWASYLNVEPTSPLSGDKCLNDLNSFGISSASEKQLSFYLAAWKNPGVYGVCQDVSSKNEIDFHLDMKDTLTAGRFLIALAETPVPNKSSRALRFQYEGKDLYIKTVSYSDGGVDSGSSFITANQLWKKFGGIWGFDVKLSIDGVQLKGKVNGVSVFSTQVSSATRYLCFAYQANQGLTATQLDAKVTFP